MSPLLYREAEAGRQRWSHREVREALRPAQEGSRSLSDRLPLLAAKLRGLLADNFDIVGADPQPLGTAVGAIDDGRGWFLADDPSDRALGPALAWADREGVEDLHFIGDDPGVTARRVREFSPSPSAWRSVGRSLEPAVPAPWPTAAAPSERARPLMDLLLDAGLDVVVEHGVVTGEVAGLEVARIVDDPDGARIDVGVGRHDRDAFAMLHGDLPPEQAVAAVAAEVRRHRQPGEANHPLARLVPERWLRSAIIGDPDLVGAESLRPVALLHARESVKAVLPAAAVGEAKGGGSVIVVCSVGVDLDLVPCAAELRSFLVETAQVGNSRLVLVLPERDVLPLTRRVTSRLVRPAEIVTVPNDWRARPPR